MNFIKHTFLVCTLTCVLAWDQSANAQWERVFGISGGNISCLADSGTNIFAATYQRGVLLSTDNGNNWTEINNGFGTDSLILSFLIKGTNIFAGTSGHGVFISSNNGSNWSPANSGLTDYGVISLAIIDSTIFAGTLANGVYISSDNGGSWIPVNNGLTVPVISSLAVSGTNIFAGTFGGGVFLSSDHGSSWAAVDNGLADSSVFSLVTSGSNIFAATLKGGVFLSSDNGSSWLAVDSGLPKVPILSLAASGSYIFAGTAINGVYLTTNNGITWAPVNTGMTGVSVCSITTLAINKSSIFAGTQSTENGIWRRSLSDVLGVENIRDNNIALAIYPNPVQKEFRIQNSEFRIAVVSIYNVLGEEVHTFKPKAEKLMKELVIDVSALSPGVYFVEAVGENKRWVGKFMKE